MHESNLLVRYNTVMMTALAIVCLIQSPGFHSGQPLFVLTIIGKTLFVVFELAPSLVLFWHAMPKTENRDAEIRRKIVYLCFSIRDQPIWKFTNSGEIANFIIENTNSHFRKFTQNCAFWFLIWNSENWIVHHSLHCPASDYTCTSIHVY